MAGGWTRAGLGLRYDILFIICDKAPVSARFGTYFLGSVNSMLPSGSIYSISARPFVTVGW